MPQKQSCPRSSCRQPARFSARDWPILAAASTCAIRLGAGNYVSADGIAVSTHGWLIPSSAVAGPRFAICWNGVVYPVVASGGLADLRADVLNAIKAEQEAREAQLNGNWRIGGVPFASSDEGSLEVAAVCHQSPTPLWACLLLRLGEVELAEKSWAACAPVEPGPRDPQEAPEDPYLDLARDWTWALFHRAVYAHMRGDDRVALSAAKALVPIWEAAEAEATKRTYPQPNPAPWERGKPSHLEEISCIGELLADQERRAALRQAGKLLPVMPAPGADPDATLAALRRALQQCPDDAHRIALLVQELEEVSAQEMDQGGLDLASDPVVSLLLQTGEAAVEPLLACLENDTRLTRSVHFSCDYNTSRYRALVSVPEAAYVALAGILDTDFFGNAITRDNLTSHGKPGRMALAKRIRDYFNKYKGLAQEERWYGILLDNRAPMSRWVDAAQKIVEPADATEPRVNTYGSGRWHKPIREPGKAVKLLGEALRSKNDPSVTKILQQRIRELPPDMARDVAMALADWDPKAAVPVLVRLTENLPPPQARDVATALAGFDAEAALPALRRLTQERGARSATRKDSAMPMAPLTGSRWSSLSSRGWRSTIGKPWRNMPNGSAPCQENRQMKTGGNSSVLS